MWTLLATHQTFLLPFRILIFFFQLSLLHPIERYTYIANTAPSTYKNSSALTVEMLFLMACLRKIHLLVLSLVGLCMLSVSLQVVLLLTIQVCSMGAFHGSSSLTSPSYNLLFALPLEAHVFLLQHIWNSGVLCLDSVACFSHLNTIFIDTQYLSDHSLWYLLCLELCLAHVIDL